MVQASEITHDFEASVLEWHPTDRVVAIGWADGMSNKNTYILPPLSLHAQVWFLHGLLMGKLVPLQSIRTTINITLRLVLYVGVATGNA